MFLPVGFMEDQFYGIGDYAVVVIVAHEWGHSIEAQIGMLNGNLLSRQTELLADCLAGAYTNYLLYESSLAIPDVGDVEEAAESLFQMGDDLPWFDPQAHGTGDEREDAFYYGIDYGYSACFEGL